MLFFEHVLPFVNHAGHSVHRLDRFGFKVLEGLPLKPVKNKDAYSRSNHNKECAYTAGYHYAFQ